MVPVVVAVAVAVVPCYTPGFVPCNAYKYTFNRPLLIISISLCAAAPASSPAARFAYMLFMFCWLHTEHKTKKNNKK